MLKSNTRQLAATLAVVAALAACDRGDRADIDTGLARVGGAVSGAVDSVGSRITGREYNTAELLGVISAHADHQVELGELAQPKATDPQVRTFAETIVREHRALKTEITNAARQANATPTALGDDSEMRRELQEALRELREQPKGKEFDKEFVEHQVQRHRSVLADLDGAIEGNRNTDIRPLLERVRTALRAHLTAAEELDNRLD